MNKVDLITIAVPVLSEIALRLYPTKKNISLISFINKIFNLIIPNFKKGSDLNHQ